tara:strand:- start:128 stop:472 length:345 start_codon:yes stop_codon:yes gene_type:complete
MIEGIKFQIEESGDVKIFRIDGRLDATSAPKLENALEQACSKGFLKIILDLADMEYLSSAGIRLILSLTKKLDNLNGGLRLCSISEDVMEIIKMAGFERILNIYPTENEALKGF